jgi:hypothetical protein
MNEQDRQKDFQLLLEVIALEEERGSIVPGGASGGAVVRARAIQGKDARSDALSSRKRVRFLAHATAASPKKKAA